MKDQIFAWLDANNVVKHVAYNITWPDNTQPNDLTKIPITDAQAAILGTHVDGVVGHTLDPNTKIINILPTAPVPKPNQPLIDSLKTIDPKDPGYSVAQKILSALDV